MNVTTIILIVALMVLWIAWHEWSYNKFRIEKELPAWKFYLIFIGGCIVLVPVLVVIYIFVRAS